MNTATRLVSQTTLARRIIPCLDVADGKVIKGQQFRGHNVVGEITDLALRYRDEGADELVFYDITASPQQRSVDISWVESVARLIDIPFTVAGGIRSVDKAEAVLAAGADKISVNTPVLENPDLINALVDRLGTQCVVVGVDSIEVTSESETGRGLIRDWYIKKYTGDPAKTADAGRKTLDWVREVEARGAGEIVLNCMSSDGMKNGYDIKQLSEVRKVTSLPLIASGGAGTMAHFSAVAKLADVDGMLAASVFHNGIIPIPELKSYLLSQGVSVRPA
ncbi:MAG: imidazole glycerol phosphate synthase subunit HisF [Gammaproteobacteria bacterium]|nr:imidazole glycerol phosphate synthase subunit HisF [Gammaproteobacteria bacterium]